MTTSRSAHNLIDLLRAMIPKDKATSPSCTMLDITCLPKSIIEHLDKLNILDKKNPP